MVLEHESLKMYCEDKVKLPQGSKEDCQLKID